MSIKKSKKAKERNAKGKEQIKSQKMVTMSKKSKNRNKGMIEVKK